MTYSEDDLLPISGLQHLMFCERQWGLIHLEQQWEENRLTAEGRVIHERAHAAGADNRPGIRTARGLRLRSLRLGLVGQADVVEFHHSDSGIAMADVEGKWRPFPVEYKRGRPKRGACDEVQLCAQALCLEEMFGGKVLDGALYYGEPRRRTEVAFGKELRIRTETLARRMHDLYSRGRTPPPVYESKCDGCSLIARCMPRLLAKPPGVGRYLSRARAVGEE
jgi:CRISPR-associated exonuclease Cas4